MAKHPPHVRPRRTIWLAESGDATHRHAIGDVADLRPVAVAGIAGARDQASDLHADRVISDKNDGTGLWVALRGIHQHRRRAAWVPRSDERTAETAAFR